MYLEIGDGLNSRTVETIQGKFEDMGSVDDISVYDLNYIVV